MTYDEPHENREDVRAQSINMENVMALVGRLAQILALEVDHLNEMNISAMEPMQNEKKWLTKAIELQLKHVQKFPHLLQEISDEDREEFAELVGVFNEIKQENYRRLLAAKEVNGRVVEAITDVVNEYNRKPNYGKQGINETGVDSVSVTLNEQI